MLYSYDVFDTLITRRTANPNGIFLLMSHLLISDSQYNKLPVSFRNSFLVLRSGAEQYISQIKLPQNNEQVTISEIYSVIGKNYGLNQTQIDSLIALEINLEYDNSVPIYENILSLKKRLEGGENVVLISDMYLSGETIRSILLKHDSIFKEISIYVSADIHLRKSTGNLYKYVHDAEHVSYSEWIHIGDDYISDIRVPKKLHINTIKYNLPQFNSVEKKLLSSNSDKLINQFIVGLSRNNRLERKTCSDRYELGLLMGGPLLYPYVNWIIESSLEKNLQDIYFLSRDGYVLKIIFDEIINVFGIGNRINPHYLYGSRKSIIADYVSPSEYHNITEPQSDFEVKEETTRRELARKYLCQEIVSGGNVDSFAIVDLAGTGRTLDEVANLLSKELSSKLHTYYLFDLSKSIESEQDKSTYSVDAYQIDEILLELFARAPHGQVLGYSLDLNQKIVPVIEGIEGNKLIDWGYNEYINGVKEFTHTFATLLRDYRIVNITPSIILNFKNILYLPDKKTLTILSSIPFTDDFNHFGREFAPKISLIGGLLYLLSNNKLSKTSYIKYSLLRGSSILKFVLNHPCLVSVIKSVIKYVVRK